MACKTVTGSQELSITQRGIIFALRLPSAPIVLVLFLVAAGLACSLPVINGGNSGGQEEQTREEGLQPGEQPFDAGGEGGPPAGVSGSICPEGAVRINDFPAAGAAYHYLEGQPALNYFDRELFPRLAGQTCWQSGATQVLFAANVEGMRRFFRYDGFETWFGDVSVLSAGCVVIGGSQTSTLPGAVVSMLGDGIEMLAVSLGAPELYYLQSTPDGSGVFNTTFYPGTGCY